MVLEVVDVHVRAKFHQLQFSGFLSYRGHREKKLPYDENNNVLPFRGLLHDVS